MKTNLRVISAGDASLYFPGSPHQYPALTDPALIGQSCFILGSLVQGDPPYKPIAHEIQLENGQCFTVLAEQIGAIE